MLRSLFPVFATLAVLGCADMNGVDSEATFPAISTDIAKSNSFSTCGDFPADRNQTARAPAVSRFDGYSSHIVQICFRPRTLTTLVFWSKTNADFSRITTALTTLDGREIPYTGSTYDPALGITTFSFQRRVALAIS